MKKFALGLLAFMLLFGIAVSATVLQYREDAAKAPTNTKPNSGYTHPAEQYGMSGPDMAADCIVEPTGENYIGVRYKALLAEDELSETGWLILFAGNGFTTGGEYQPHFILEFRQSMKRWADAQLNQVP